jgi:hypothetical protein
MAPQSFDSESIASGGGVLRSGDLTRGFYLHGDAILES